MDFSKPDNARKINKLKVMNLLRGEKLSRAELSRALLLSKVSISEIVEELLKDGLIETAEKDTTTSGRPATKMQIKKNAGRVFAIEIKKKVVSVSISDMLGRPLRFERFPRGENLWNEINSLVEKLAQGYKIYGACFVLYEELDIPEFPFPVTKTTPAVAQAKAEINLATANLDNFYFVSWSDQIEGAYTKHGNVLSIPSFAHIKVTKNATCDCGGNGCLEAVASGDRLKEKTEVSAIRDLIKMPEISEAAKSMVFAISQAVQSTGAKAVMLTGELSQLSDELYATMQTRLSLSLPPDRDQVFIFRSQCGERGSREGAGIIALEEFFYKTELVNALAFLELNRS